MPFEVIGDLFGVHLDEADRLRPRPDQRHLPLEDIVQLRHLVQPGLAHDPAHPGDPVVIGRGPVDVVAVGAVDHRPQLPGAKRDVVPADAQLAVKYRPPRIELDRQSDEGKQRQGQAQPDTGDRKIGQPFHVPEVALVQRRQFMEKPLVIEIRTRTSPTTGSRAPVHGETTCH